VSGFVGKVTSRPLRRWVEVAEVFRNEFEAEETVGGASGREKVHFLYNRATAGGE